MDFATDDDVGDDVLLLESPEPVAEPAVGDLHLVGDRQAAAGAHRRVDLLQVAVGQRHAAGVAVHRLGDERRGRAAVGDQALDLGDRLSRVPAGVGAAELAAEAVGRLARCAPNPGRVARAFGLSATDVETASVAYVHPW